MARTQNQQCAGAPGQRANARCFYTQTASFNAVARRLLETRVLAPEALPFEPKLTKVSAPQARLLAARPAKSSKRLRVPTEPAPYLQTTP